MLYGLGLQKSGGLAIPESCHAEKIAGKDWLEGFRKGNGAVSLWTLEATGLGRVSAFNRTTVAELFANLEHVLEHLNFLLTAYII